MNGQVREIEQGGLELMAYVAPACNMERFPLKLFYISFLLSPQQRLRHELYAPPAGDATSL
jgi:hypothetical protein